MEAVDVERSRALAHRNLRVADAYVENAHVNIAGILQPFESRRSRSHSSRSLEMPAKIGPTGKMRHNLSHSCLPSPAAIYHGIHFPFLGSGSMSFLGTNLNQPSLLASFFSGTWPM